MLMIIGKEKEKKKCDQAFPFIIIIIIIINKVCSATWVLIWDVILGFVLYQFCNLNDTFCSLKSVTPNWRYLDCNGDTLDLNYLDYISIWIWAQPNPSADFFFERAQLTCHWSPILFLRVSRHYEKLKCQWTAYFKSIWAYMNV